MRFAPGSRLGPYEIASALGAGGMGEVYRAHDPRLGRDVAIKVLPADRMADEARRHRFVQEARAASALNHPNIVTIHEIESADGVDFIVMEYVPGRSLDGLIPKGGMRLGDALKNAIPVADALAAAHAKGIVHRDVKPANVVVTREGAVKVLDFGLAKLVTDERSDDAQTVTAAPESGPLSRPGTITGTTAYMSPEQAAGGRVDARSDVFSFGAVLYEMTTGHRAFARETAAETLAAVLREHPRPPRELVPAVPRELERLILRCLRKEPEKRFQHMLDVKLELEQILEESASLPLATVAAPGQRRVWPVAGATAALVIAAVAIWQMRPLPPEPTRVVPLTSTPGAERYPTFSPDGEQVAFDWEGVKPGNRDIYVKMIGSSEVHRVTTDPAADVLPSWSPDGRSIAFVRSTATTNAIHLVSPLGGPDRKLADLPARPGRLSWSRDGRWLALASDLRAAAPVVPGIRVVRVPEGDLRIVTSPVGTVVHYNPAFSPDGRQLAYTSSDGWWAWHVEVVALGSDSTPKGPARRLTRRAMVMEGGLAWAPDGRSLVYGGGAPSRLWRVGTAGDEAAEVIEAAGYGVWAPTFAASRGRLAFMRISNHTDIFRFEEGRPLEVVAASSFPDGNPWFSPDGRRFVFESQRSGQANEIWMASVDGSTPTQLTHGPGFYQGSPAWSPNGRTVAFDSYAENGYSDIWTIDADGGRLRRLTSHPGGAVAPTWSRDGRVVYFVTGHINNRSVWRIPAGGGREEQISRSGGGFALESFEGKFVFFTREFAPSPLLSVPIGGGAEQPVIDCVRGRFDVAPAGLYYYGCDTDPSGVGLRRRDLATGREQVVANLPGSGLFTVSPDGKTILLSKFVGEGSDLMLIENFR
jgi:Tol biopolymer transport system component/predicted Ser/Thr protein kinase